MCGIIGYIGQKQVLPILIDGLRRLEYRGYDSAGVAVLRNGKIELRRSAGKLARHAVELEFLEVVFHAAVTWRGWCRHFP